MCVKRDSSGDAKELGESLAELLVRDFTTVGLLLITTRKSERFERSQE